MFFTAISESGSCPHGWLEYGNNCYSIEDHEERWLSAHEYCRYLGSNLVSFQDNEEADYIKGIYHQLLTTLQKPSLNSRVICLLDTTSVYMYVNS